MISFKTLLSSATFPTNDRSALTYQFTTSETIKVVKSVQLVNFSLMNSEYTITPQNNAFLFNATPLNIPPGTYDIFVFATALQDLLNNNGFPNVVVTINIFDMKLRITNDSPFTIFFQTPPQGFLSLWYILGFSSNTVNSGNDEVISDFPVRLLNNSKVLIQVDVNNVSLNNNMTSDSIPYAFCVDFFSNFGQLNVFYPRFKNENCVSVTGGKIAVSSNTVKIRLLDATTRLPMRDIANYFLELEFKGTS